MLYARDWTTLRLIEAFRASELAKLAERGERRRRRSSGPHRLLPRSQGREQLKEVCMETAAKQKPAAVVAAGTVRASVWANERVANGETFTSYAVRLERRYKDKDGTWKSTNAFGVGELPKAILVLQRVYEELVLGKDAADGEGSA